MKKVGVALGGGGAKGFAHIAYLQAMDEMGVKPSCISGTSMGSIIGALYAVGYSPENILEALDSLSAKRLTSPGLLSRLQFVPPTLTGSLVKRLLRGFFGGRTFEDAKIPLKTVAVNFHTLEEKVFTSGSILDGVMASIALPGFFPPYFCGSEYYIDGGALNIVPFNTLRDECDILVAIDVSTQRANPGLAPTAQNAYLATWNAASSLILDYQFAGARIEILERPEFPDIGSTQFDQYKRIYTDTKRGIPEFREKLGRLL
jgi:NTE family protein